MNKYLISMMSGTLLFTQMAAAAPAKLLGPDTVGRPKIQIVNSGKYYIFHSFDGMATSCDPAFYVKTAPDSNGLEWCRTINRYAQGTTLSDPVPFAATRLNSPIEIQYRAGVAPTLDFSQYIGWSPKKDSVADDRIESWLELVESRNAVEFQTEPVTLAGQIATTSAKGAVKKVVVTYGSNSLDWYLYYNNKYIALFNHNGGLIALTHTAYGDDMINPAGRDSTTVRFNDQAAFRLDVTGLSDPIFPQSMDAPTIDSNGALHMNWTLNGNAVAIDWLLTSLSTADQPSGLAGHATVVNNTGSYKPLTLYFPVVFGLTSGESREVPEPVGKRLYIPAENSGTTLVSRAQEDGLTGTPANRGAFYPTVGWQSQFIAVATTANDSVLISANDPNQFAKAFNARDFESNGSAGRTQFVFYPQNGSSTEIDTGGSVTLSPMHGDWVAAATKYRNWAAVQNWGAADNTVLQTIASKNIDPTLKKGVYWWSERVSAPDGMLRPTAFEVDASRQKEVIGETTAGGNVATGFHLAGWWDRAFDTNYPQFNAISDGLTPTFPYWVQTPVPAPTVLKTWADAIETVQGNGSLVAPYINAVGIDMSDAPDDVTTGIKRKKTPCPVDTNDNGWWNRDLPVGDGMFDLKSELLLDRSGVPFSESFGDTCRTFAFADPTLYFWRYVLYRNVADVFSTLGSNGIYLDSFAHANTFLDRKERIASTPGAEEFADEQDRINGGIPAGMGNWIRTGYRGMGEYAQAAVEASSGEVRKFVAAEFFSEVVLPYIDIVFDYHDPKPDELPIIQATFGNYQLFAGQRPLADASFVAKKAVVGRSFLWGNQMGLSWYKYYCRFYTWPAPLPSPPCSDSGSLDIFDYTRTLAQAREAVQAPSIGLEWSKAKFIGMLDGAGTGFLYASVANGGQGDDWCLSASCAATVPRLRGALWSSTGSDEPDFLLLTNTSTNSLAASFTLPPSWQSINLVHGSATVSSSSGSYSITLAGNGVAVFKAVHVSAVDMDADGIVDSTDDDDDNDGVLDTVDAFPGNEAASVDTDHDGKPDAWNSGCGSICQSGSGLTLDTDNDNDGVLNTVDNCPNVANPAQTDSNSDGQGDACEPHGLTVVYFNDTDTNTSGSINENDDKLVPPVVLQRVEPNIDFSYDKYTGPGSGVNADYYSARFTGRLIVPAYTGNYTFCLTGDDGVRMWINNIDLWGNVHWKAQDSVSDCATVSLTAGQSVPIKMEFFDLTEEAIAKLEWSWPGHTTTVVPSSSLYAE